MDGVGGLVSEIRWEAGAVAGGERVVVFRGGDGLLRLFVDDGGTGNCERANALVGSTRMVFVRGSCLACGSHCTHRWSASARAGRRWGRARCWSSLEPNERALQHETAINSHAAWSGDGTNKRLWVGEDRKSLGTYLIWVCLPCEKLWLVGGLGRLVLRPAFPR